MTRISDRLWVVILAIPSFYFVYRFLLQNKIETEWGYPPKTPFVIILVLIILWLLWILAGFYNIGKEFTQTHLFPILEFLKVSRPIIQPTYNTKDFSNIAATEKTWVQIRRIVDQFLDRKKYKRIKAKRPRGILIIGKKESGRRAIAMAIAGEIKAAFFCISAHELVASVESRLKLNDVFMTVKKAENAVIFIEHTESLLEYPAIYHELGYKIQALRDENPEQNIIVMCSVEYWGKFILDRYFDETILVDMPNVKSIEKTLWIYLRGISLSNMDIHKAAKIMTSLTYGQIEWAVNTAAINAAGHAVKAVTIQDLQAAIAALEPPALYESNRSAQ